MWLEVRKWEQQGQSYNQSMLSRSIKFNFFLMRPNTFIEPTTKPHSFCIMTIKACCPALLNSSLTNTWVWPYWNWLAAEFVVFRSGDSARYIEVYILNWIWWPIIMYLCVYSFLLFFYIMSYFADMHHIVCLEIYFILCVAWKPR